MKKPLTLIKTEEYEGYEYQDILRWLGRKEGNKFGKWMIGKTGGLLNNKLIVYRWDWEKYENYRQSSK